MKFKWKRRKQAKKNAKIAKMFVKAAKKEAKKTGARLASIRMAE